MSVIYKTKSLRKLAETWENEEKVSVLLKLYRNFLHQVSADWNFAETFQYVFALLKLDWNLHIRFPLTETWRNPAETIQLFPHCWNYTGNFNSKFLYSFSRVSVLLKRYFSSSVKCGINVDIQILYRYLLTSYMNENLSQGTMNQKVPQSFDFEFLNQ